jgi:manganese transport protein
MAGFINFQIPLALRRAITMTPALAIGINPTSVLVLSQVVLSFGIPLALVPLVILTGRRDIMGIHANGRTLAISAWTIAIAISLMNVFLIYRQFFLN